MLCLECGYLNAKEQQICARCGRTIVSSGSVPRLMNRLRQMEQMVHSIKYGQMTLQEFGADLDGLEKIFRENLEDLQHMEIPPDFAPQMAQEVEVGTLGIETFIEAVQSLRSYIMDRKLFYLEEGLAKARIACDLVNTAMALNWREYESLRESMEDFLRGAGA